MNRSLMAMSVGLLLLTGCGPADPHDARFKGTWSHVIENGLTNLKDESILSVTADHVRFRIEEDSGKYKTVEVFDGTTLFRKMTTSPITPPDLSINTASEQPVEAPMSPSTSSQPMTVTQTGSRRFWSSTYSVGHSEAGGLVAGQDTLLYKVSEHRMDGDLSEQQWVDAKTGVLLKSVATIYSSQVKSMVRQETWECRTIDYSPPADSEFQKP